MNPIGNLANAVSSTKDFIRGDMSNPVHFPTASFDAFNPMSSEALKAPNSPKPTVGQKVEWIIGRLAFQIYVLGAEKSLKKTSFGSSISYQGLADGILSRLSHQLVPFWKRPWPLEIVVIGSSDAECQCFSDGHISIGDKQIKKIMTASADPLNFAGQGLNLVFKNLSGADLSDIAPDHVLAAGIAHELLFFCSQRRLLTTVIRTCLALISNLIGRRAIALVNQTKRYLLPSSPQKDERVMTICLTVLKSADYNPLGLSLHHQIRSNLSLTRLEKLGNFKGHLGLLSRKSGSS